MLIHLMTNQTREIQLIELALNRLTASEKKVLYLIGAGLTNQEIAANMGVSLSTVKTHINNMYQKLQVPNRKLIIQWAKSLPFHNGLSK